MHDIISMNNVSNLLRISLSVPHGICIENTDTVKGDTESNKIALKQFSFSVIIPFSILKFENDKKAVYIKYFLLRRHSLLQPCFFQPVYAEQCFRCDYYQYQFYYTYLFSIYAHFIFKNFTQLPDMSFFICEKQHFILYSQRQKDKKLVNTFQVLKISTFWLANVFYCYVKVIWLTEVKTTTKNNPTFHLNV